MANDVVALMSIQSIADVAQLVCVCHRVSACPGDARRPPLHDLTLFSGQACNACVHILNSGHRVCALTGHDAPHVRAGAVRVRI